jgi:hypothetical protein
VGVKSERPDIYVLADMNTIQKLQELIRRGTPKDLAAAQELMKIMSGAVSLSLFATTLQEYYDKLHTDAWLLRDHRNQARNLIMLHNPRKRWLQYSIGY